MYDSTALDAMKQAEDILQQALTDLRRHIEREQYKVIESEVGEMISVADEQCQKK